MTLADGAARLVRVDFTDEEAWRRLVEAVLAPADFGGADDHGDEDEGYVPNITPVSDQRYEDWTREQVVDSVGPESAGFLLVADKQSMDPDEPSVVFVDLVEEPGRAFRCAVQEVASVEVNLDLANLDFADFADHVDEDGVFRGFEQESHSNEAAGAAVPRVVTPSGDYREDLVRSLVPALHADLLAVPAPARRRITKWVIRRTIEEAGLTSWPPLQSALSALDADLPLPHPWNRGLPPVALIGQDPTFPEERIKGADGTSGVKQVNALFAVVAAGNHDPQVALVHAVWAAFQTFGASRYKEFSTELSMVLGASEH